MQELESCKCEDKVRRIAEAKYNIKLPKTLHKGQIFSCFNLDKKMAIEVHCKCGRRIHDPEADTF